MVKEALHNKRYSALAHVASAIGVTVLCLVFPGAATAHEDGSVTEIAIRAGDRFYWSGDYANAELKFSDAIAAEDSAIAYNNRGLARMKQGKFAEAEADFDKAKERLGYSAPYLNKGKCLAAHKKFAEAIAEFQAGILVRNQGELPWRKVCSAPWGTRFGHTVLEFDGKIWVIGGAANSSYNLVYNDVWCSSNGWDWTQVTGTAPWAARAEHTSVVYDNKMWVIGGHARGYGNAYRDVWCSSDGVNWTCATAGASFGNIAGPRSLVYQGRMWVIDGEVYSPVTNNSVGRVYSSSDGVNWILETAAAAWEARYGFGAVVYKDRMWVIGGRTETIPSDAESEAWCSWDGKTWTLGARTFRVRGIVGTAVFNDQAWLMGQLEGLFCSDSCFDVSLRVSEGGGFGSAKHASAGRVPGVPVVFDNKLWAVGVGVLDGLGSVYCKSDGRFEYNLGWVYDELGRYADAMAYYDAALEAEPGNQSIRVARAVSLAKQGNAASARDELGVAAGRASGNGTQGIAKYNLGVLDGPGLGFHDAEAAQSFKEGIFELNAGSANSALDLFQAAIAREDDLPDVAVLLHLSVAADHGWDVTPCPEDHSDPQRITVDPSSGTLYSFGSGPSSPIAPVRTSTDGFNWTTVAQTLPVPDRSGYLLLFHSGKLWLIGGHSSSSSYTDAWSSVDGVSWVLESDALSPFFDWSLGTSFRGQMWGLGRYWDFSYSSSDVFSSSDGVTWVEVGHTPMGVDSYGRDDFIGTLGDRVFVLQHNRQYYNYMSIASSKDGSLWDSCPLPWEGGYLGGCWVRWNALWSACGSAQGFQIWRSSSDGYSWNMDARFDDTSVFGEGVCFGDRVLFGGSCVATFGDARARANTAGFVCSETVGDRPLTVQFTDTSSGIVTSRAWSLGDGSSSPEANPVHTYQAPGTYRVQLVTKAPGWQDAAGESITVNEVYGTVEVTVNAPAATWSFTDYSGRVHSGTGSQVLASVPAGPIALTWDSVTGFDTPTQPPPQTLLKNGSVAFGGVYARHMGCVQIDVTPATAPWSFVDGDNQIHTGTGSRLVTNVPTGVISLTWKPLEGYLLPTQVSESRGLNKDSTTGFSGHYACLTGTVWIGVSPETAPWSFVDSKGTRYSGVGSGSVSKVDPGEIRFSWGSLPNYVSPTNPPSQVLAMDSATGFSGTFVRETGIVHIDVSGGGPWSFTDGDGQVHDGRGSAERGDIPTGTITLTWLPMDNHTVPQGPETQTLTPGDRVSFSGRYERFTGTVEVCVTPAFAGWLLTDGDGMTRNGNGTGTVSNVPTGEISLLYYPLNGYLSPASPVRQTLARDGTARFTGTYTCVVGNVQVNVTPSYASWSFTDGNGEIHNGVGRNLVEYVPKGEIRLTWKGLPSFTAPEEPAPQVLSPEGTITFTGVYTRQAGTVQVNAPSFAEWSFTDGDGQEHRGIGTRTVTGIPTGSIALTWVGTAYYYAPQNPPSQTLEANGTVAFTGVYTRQTGTVQVNVSPSTAPWSFTDGDGQTHSGTGTRTVTNVPTGYVSFTWGPLANHIIPAGPNPTTQSLDARATLTFNGAYRTTGTVKIDVTPASAPWSFTDADGQVHRGVGPQTTTNIPTGTLSLRWGALTSYIAPQDPPSRTLNAGETATFTGTYRATGTVYVQVTPETAPWSFTDGDGKPHSGTGTHMILDVPTGPITLSWSALTGYATPANPPAQTLTTGERVAFAGDYAGVGTVRVNVSPSTVSWSIRDGNDNTYSGVGSQTLTGVATGWLRGVSMMWGELDGFVISGQSDGGFRSLTPGGTVTFTATYVRATGSVGITIESYPSQGFSDFPWSFTDGDGQTHSGVGSQTVNNVPTGQIALAWGDTPNYSSPAPPSSQRLDYGGTVGFWGAFTRHTGTIQIVTSSFRVPWSFVDGDGRTHTGRGSQTVSAPTGTISFTWLPLDGYVTPDPATVVQVLAKDSSVTFSADYVEEEAPGGCAGRPSGGGGTTKGRTGDLVVTGALVLALAILGRSKRPANATDR